MAKYRTKKINGVDAVHIGDLGLKHGRISTQNSLPYIDVNHADKLIAMDNQMGALGSPYYITSSMGGQHQPGTRSHSAGQKIDIAPQSGIFSRATQDYLNNNFVGNGAIGNEGNHWDLSFIAKGGNPTAMNQQPILRQQPGVLNAQPDIVNLYQGGQLTNAQIYDAMKQAQAELAAKYDIARAAQSAEQNINRATQQALPNINEQMMTNVEDPMELQHTEMHAYNTNDIARQQAINDLESAKQEYQQRLTPEQMANAYNAQVQQFLDVMNAQNPYRQVQGQVNPYNINMDEYRKAQGRDNTYRTYMMGAAMMNASNNPQLAAIQMQAAQQGLGNQAEQYLKNAQLEYQAQVANQLGIPPEQVAALANQQASLTEKLAPSVASAYKEAQVLQPNQNLRTYMEQVPKTSEDVYKDTILDQQARVENQLNRNKMYQTGNLVGAQAQAKALEDITKMYGNYPKQVLEKYQTEAGNVSKPNQALLQGTTSMTTNAMKELQDNTQNINTQLQKAYEEQGKDLRKAQDLISKQIDKAQEKTKEISALKQVKEKNDFLKSLLGTFTDKERGGMLQGTEKQFMQELRNAGFSDSEIVQITARYY